jgi:thiopeptide-type bacteriocin biosynthesis protein
VRFVAAERWIQWNVQLDRSRGNAEASARAVFAALRPLIRKWKRQHALRWFFFMRKRPDMRLRFCGPDPRRILRPKLVCVLDSLAAGHDVRRHFESVYEPETRLFGGSEAMRLVHAYFDADSAAWMDLDRFAELGRRTTLPERLAAGVLNDLFSLTLEDRSEVWDVWSRLSTDVAPEEDALHPVPALDISGLLCPLIPAPEANVLKRYGRANHMLAKGLCQLWSRGVLTSGLRGTLTYVALFHFNRHGIDGVRRNAVARAMRDCLTPRQFGRGAVCT